MSDAHEIKRRKHKARQAITHLASIARLCSIARANKSQSANKRKCDVISLKAAIAEIASIDFDLRFRRMQRAPNSIKVAPRIAKSSRELRATQAICREYQFMQVLAKLTALRVFKLCAN